MIKILLLFLCMSFIVIGCASETEIASDTMKVDVYNFNSFLERGDIVIIDVRTKDEYSDFSIENSINIDFMSKNFKEEIKNLDSSKTYLIYCRSGRRSSDAIKVMRNLGFNNVYDLDGGVISLFECC